MTAQITKADVWIPKPGESIPYYWKLTDDSVRVRAAAAGYRYGTKGPGYTVYDVREQMVALEMQYRDLPDGKPTKETDMSKSEGPKYLAEVYLGYEGGNDRKARDDAREAGFRYYTWGTQSHAYSVDRGHIGDGWMTRDLEGPSQAFLDYIGRPERSMREDVFRRVTQAGFFRNGQTANEQIRILTDLYSASGPYCKDGIDRFYAAMGNAMPPRGPARKVFTVQIEVPVTFQIGNFMEGAQSTLDKDYGGNLAVKIISVED